MGLLSDWNDFQSELETACKQFYKDNNKEKPPADILALLDTKDLKDALKLADASQQSEDVDGARKAQAKSQKFFLMYANQFKAAKVAAHTDAKYQTLSDALNMYLVHMTRTQVAVAKLADGLIQKVKANTASDAKKLELSIKSALAPLKFQYDWKAGKKDFEKETGKKKPSEKVMDAFRKATGVDKALAALDKACEDADPVSYRKDYAVFVRAKTDYSGVLDKALQSDKAADPIYKKKCEGLKDLLSSIEGRAKEKINMLDQLNA